MAVSVALSAAIANSLVAQAATARLLFSMARDGQLPRFLAHVHPVRRVPERAVLLVSVVSLVLGLFFVGQVGLLSSLVNFGALFSFLLLHVSVVVYFHASSRRRGAFGLHLVSPVIGFVVIAFVLANADAHAKIGGSVWLAVGVVMADRLAARGALDGAQAGGLSRSGASKGGAEWVAREEECAYVSPTWLLPVLAAPVKV